MKKVLCLLTVLTMAIGCIGINVSAAEYGIVLNNNVALMVGSTRAVANNTLCNIAVAPAEVDGVMFVPLRSVAQLLNGTVSYDSASGVTEISFGVEKKLAVRSGSGTYTLNGRGYSFSAAPYESGDETMVPVTDLGKDIVGQTVFYDSNTKVAVISSRGVIKDAVTDAAVLSTIASAITSGNLPPITVPTSYQLDWSAAEETVAGIVGGSDQTTVETVKVTPVNIIIDSASEPQSENPGRSAFDGDTGTRWACDGDGELVADLGSSMMITEIKMAWWKWEERSASYEIEISSDGSNYTSVFSGSAKGEFYEVHEVNQQARYVKIKSHGNTASTWNSLLECEIYTPGKADSNSAVAAGGKIAAASGTKVSISGSMVKASSEPEAENPGGNIADGNSSSVWAAEGSANAIIDLGSVIPVSCVGVQMKPYDDGRAIKFGVAVSADGNAYTNLYDGQSVENGGTMEYIGAGVEARYVKISVNGSTTGSWASVAEVEVYTGTGGGAVSGTSNYPNMSNVSGEFVIAQYGTTNVLTVGSDNMTLSLGGNTKDSKQIWTLDGTGIKNKGTSYFMDVSGQSYDEGGQILVWEGNGGDNQSWSLELEGDGYYIRSSMSGLYLTANGGSIEQRSKGSATKWVIADPNAEAVIGGAAASTSNYANMSNVSGEFIIAKYGTATVLTVGSDNMTLSLGGNTKDSKQIWTLDGTGIKNKGTSYFMDVSGQSYDEGGQILVWEGNGGDNQSWSLELEGDGYYIRSSMSGLYLTANGGSIEQRSKGSATKWVIADPNAEAVISGGNGTVIAGEFKISVFGTEQALAVGSDGATLLVEKSSSKKNQRWVRGANSNGDALQNVGTELFLDVSGQSMDEGAQIGVWEGNDGSNQAWILEQSGEGYYIKSVMSGLYLTLNNGSLEQRSKDAATMWEISGDEVTIVSNIDPNTPVKVNKKIDGSFRVAIYGTNSVLTIERDGTLGVERNEGLSGQIWTMEDGENGFVVVNKDGESVIDVSNNSTDENIRVCVSQKNGAASQAWALEKVGNYYYIKNVNSGLYASYDGTAVRQKSFAYATKWIFRPAE